MGWSWNYGQGVLNVPAAALDVDASPAQLAVLLWLSSDLSLAEKPIRLAKLASIDRAAAEEALAFWSSCGLLSQGETKQAPPAAPASKKEQKTAPAPKVLQRADELPTYTQTELADIIESRSGLRVLVDESQRIMGKMFNPMEVNVLLGMVDWLKLSEEYVLLLLAHAKRIGVKSMRQIERHAIALVDEGITEPDALNEKLRRIEDAKSLEGRVRSLFGMGSRALTAKEQKFFEDWSSYGYGEEEIRLAYEMTANSTGKASLAYANSILKGWHSEGLKSKAEIEKKMAEEKAAREGAAAFGNSFATDEFFEAALQKTYGSKKENA